MTPARILLAASVAFNVGLLTLLVLFFSTSPPEKPPSPPAPVEMAARPAAGPDAEETASTVAPTETQPTAVAPDSQTSASELRTLYNRLRSLGMDEDRARRVVAATAMSELSERLARQTEDRFGKEFWRVDQGSEHRQLYADYVRQRRLIEDDLIEATGAPHPLQDYMERPMGIGHLAPEQQRDVILIEEDYQLLQQEIHARSGSLGPLLPEDIEALRLLEEERRRDLAALLPPDELLEYELRNSTTSDQLRHDLRIFEPTEEEFRTIFALRRELDLIYGQDWGFADEDTRQSRTAAEEALNEQLRQLLGEERHAAYEMSQDHAYTMLVDLTERLGLPREKAAEVHLLQNLVQEKQEELMADSDLTQEDRREANQMLWEETRRTMVETLGEEGMKLYQRYGGWWLHGLEIQAETPR